MEANKEEASAAYRCTFYCYYVYTDQLFEIGKVVARLGNPHNIEYFCYAERGD